MQSDDSRLGRDDESSHVEHTNGLYISSYMCVGFYCYICMDTDFNMVIQTSELISLPNVLLHAITRMWYSQSLFMFAVE